MTRLRGPARAEAKRLARQRARWLARTRPGPRRLAWAVALSLAGAFWLVALGLRLWPDLWPLSELWRREPAAAGYRLVRGAAAVPFLLVPLFFAPLFAAETELGTMEALCLTPMRRETIAGGRVRAAWRPVGLFLLAALPLFLFVPRYASQPHLLAYALPGGAFLHTAPPPTGLGVTGRTVAAGAAVWGWVWVNARALAWVSTAFSVRCRAREAALAWSFLSSLALLAFAYGARCGVLHLCTRGLARGAYARLLWDLRPAVIGATVAQIGLVGLAGLLVRRALPGRFDQWAMGREA